MQLIGSFILWILVQGVLANDCSDLQIEDIKFELSNNLLFVRWNKSEEYHDCDCTVTTSSNVPSYVAQTITTRATIEILNVVPCSTVTIDVTPVGGKTVTASRIIDSKATKAPTINEINYSCNSVQIVWDVQPYEENMCEVTHFQTLCYTDTYRFTQNSALTDNTTRTFSTSITGLTPDVNYRCNGYVYASHSGYSLPSDDVEFSSIPEPVKDLNVWEDNGLLGISWVAPWNSEECDVVYDVKIENELLGNETLQVSNVSLLLDIEMLPYSEYIVTVTPILLAGAKGPAASYTLICSALPEPVKDLQIWEEDGSIVSSWEVLWDSEDKDVVYEVKYENEVLGSGSSQVANLSSVLDIEVIPCSEYVITVTPVSLIDGSKGPTASVTITTSASIGEITNLKADQDAESGGILLTWDNPASGLCEVEYKVTHEIDDSVYDTQLISDTNLVLNRPLCASSTFKVQPVNKTVEGKEVFINWSVEDAIEANGEVQNVSYKDQVISWEAPSSISSCNILYHLEVENDFGVSELHTVETSANFDIIPCSVNVVKITVIYNNITGKPAIESITGPTADLSMPKHIKTIPDFTSASVTLEADPLSVNSCDVEGVEVYCSCCNGTEFERVMSVNNDGSRVFTVELDALQADELYSCKAYWSNSDKSAVEFSFRTIQLYENELVIESVGENGTTISFIETYDGDFVSEYSLIVETIGPVHAVRDTCEIERNVSRTYIVDVISPKLEIDDWLSNYQYKLTLITIYTLGVEVQSKPLLIQTTAGVPGKPENLTYTFIQGSEGYDVKAVLNWVSPCDLHGSLEGFTAKVVGRFDFGGTEQSVEYDVEIEADEDEVNNVFVYELNKLSPFFTYEFSVATKAAFQGDRETISFTPPAIVSRNSC